jgi:hypothetical protein
VEVRVFVFCPIHEFSILNSQLETEFPDHPFVKAIAKKEGEFDELVLKFTVPPPAISTAA